MESYLEFAAATISNSSSKRRWMIDEQERAFSARTEFVARGGLQWTDRGPLGEPC